MVPDGRQFCAKSAVKATNHLENLGAIWRSLEIGKDMGGCQNYGPFVGIHIKRGYRYSCRYGYRFIIWVVVKVRVPL